MTFLCFGSHNGAIQIAMDTLVSIETGETMYEEKTYYMENPKAMVSTKGSINILGPFIIEMLEYGSNFSVPQDLERFARIRLNRHLKERIRRIPRVKNQPAEVWIFYWQEGKPAFFHAKHSIQQEEFIFTQGILEEDRIGNTNNTSLDTPLALANRSEIGTALEESELKYGKNSYKSSAIFYSVIAKINEKPYIGGNLFLYTLEANSDEFKKEIIYQLSPPTSELVTIWEITKEANGTLDWI